MRVLMITNPTTRGHINPLVGVVEQLRAAGAEVGWLALTHKQARDLERLPVTVLPTERELPLPRGGERGRWFDDDATKLATFKGICIDSVEPMFGCTLRAIDRFDPMVLAVDTVSWLGGAAAHCSGRPYLGICMGLKLLHADGLDFPYRRLVRALDGPRDALFQRLGWHPEVRLMECMSPHGNVTFATKALVGDDLGVDALNTLVGPSLPRGPRGDEPELDLSMVDDGRPLVLASFGTLFWEIRSELLAVIADATADVGARLVMAAGGFAAEARRLPSTRDAIVVEYMPQLQLLALADAFVTHGGANSTMEAAAAGCPQLVVPIDVDQPLQKFFVERAGVGTGLLPEHLTRDACAEALARLLAREWQASTLAVAESYRAHDGAANTARRIMSLAEGRPLQGGMA